MKRPWLFGLAGLVCGTLAVSSQYEVSATGSGSGLAAESLNLSGILEPIRARYGLPSLAAVAVRDGRVVGAAATGERALGSGVRVTTDDAYHLGSMSKSFTATLIGKLVELGKLRWDETLLESFPNLNMLEVFKSVRLDQLLIHTAGFSANVGSQFYDPALDPSTARRRILETALGTKPQYPPGRVVAYSNTSYIVASLVAERAGGDTWENLVRRFILEPLGLKSCAFGVTFPSLTGPHPHAWDGKTAVPLEPSLENGNSPAMNGADNLRCSLPDLGIYLAAHLAGERGQDGLLKAATFQELHRARANGGQGIYAAFGWFVFSDGRVWHNGSNTLNYSEMEFFPKDNLAVATATNAPLELNKGAQEALEAVYEALRP
jgi:CubicO group peptidase (beta-lactamase class C family)